MDEMIKDVPLSVKCPPSGAFSAPREKLPFGSTDWIVTKEREPIIMKTTKKPEIVCLCGSTRFLDAFAAANARLTTEGKIVLSIGLTSRPHEATPVQKNRLDALHLHKIEMADRVHVLNVDGYVGDSTRREIAFAIANGKRITWHEPMAGAQYLVDTWDKLNETMAAL